MNGKISSDTSRYDPRIAFKSPAQVENRTVNKIGFTPDEALMCAPLVIGYTGRLHQKVGLKDFTHLLEVRLNPQSGSPAGFRPFPVTARASDIRLAIRQGPVSLAGLFIAGIRLQLIPAYGLLPCNGHPMIDRSGLPHR